jgi:hypothetical protein
VRCNPDDTARETESWRECGVRVWCKVEGLLEYGGGLVCRAVKGSEAREVRDVYTVSCLAREMV